MSDFATIKTEIQKGVRAFKAFENGEQVLSMLEGLEQNEKQLREAISASQDTLAGLNEKLADKDAEVSEAEAHVKKLIDDAKEKVEKILNDAEVKAEMIVNDAKAVAAKYEKEASEREQDLVVLEKEIITKTEELSAIQNTVAKQKEALAGALSTLT